MQVAVHPLKLMANNPVPSLVSTFISIDAPTVSQPRTVVSCGKLRARDHPTTPRCSLAQFC